MDVLPQNKIPHGISFEWGMDDGMRTVEAVHYYDGTFAVHHQLPPQIETTAILRAAGVKSVAIASILTDKKASAVDMAYFLASANEALGMLPAADRARNASRVPTLIGRLCLPKGILEIVKPISVPGEPDELSLEILTEIASGKGWQSAAEKCNYSIQALVKHVRTHYYPGVFGQKVNTDAHVLHAYGAGILNPTTVVAQQTDPAPRLPLTRTSQPVQRPSHSAITARGPSQEQLWEDSIPEHFTPFVDPDKIIHVTRGDDGKPRLSHVETNGAILEVAGQDAIMNWTGKYVTLSFKDKLAMTLTALGASDQELRQHRIKSSYLTMLRKKLGVTPVAWIGFTEITLLTCRELLSPITPPEWFKGPSGHFVPDFSWTSEYMASNDGLAKKEKVSKSIRQKVSTESFAYTLDDSKPEWCGINLMILLGHADDLIPEDILNNVHTGYSKHKKAS